MYGWINRLFGSQKLKDYGDPGMIVGHINSLEEEIAMLKLQIEQMKVVLENKTAEIQYLEAVNRSKW